MNRERRRRNGKKRRDGEGMGRKGNGEGMGRKGDGE